MRGKKSSSQFHQSDYIFLKYFPAGWNLVGIERLWTTTALKIATATFIELWKKRNSYSLNQMSSSFRFSISTLNLRTWMYVPVCVCVHSHIPTLDELDHFASWFPLYCRHVRLLTISWVNKTAFLLAHSLPENIYPNTCIEYIIAFLCPDSSIFF